MTAEQPRHDASEPDPLVGNEIMRISLESLGVHIDLNKSQVQIKSDFFVRRPSHAECKILQISRSADMSALWSSVGSRIASVTWGHDLIIETDNGVQIVVPPSPFGSRGTILSGEGDQHFWDDF